MLNDTLITKQSGSEGKPCSTVYVVEEVDLKQEIYLSILLDREKACPVIIASPQGGMGIEDIDKKYILQHPLNVQKGLTSEDID